jgi:SHS2 domain-containing protein
MYRFVDHTAELEVELEAESAEGVLRAALRAFAELAGHAAAGETIERSVVVEAGDLPALLAAWIEELVFLAETEGFVSEDADLSLSDLRLSALLRGRRGEPRPLVKAVTMHRLRFRPENGGWSGRVVLDV